MRWVDERRKLTPGQPSMALPPWPPGTDVTVAGEGGAVSTAMAAIRAKIRREARRSEAAAGGGSNRKQRP